MNVLRPKATASKCGVVPMTIRRWSTDPKYAHLGFPKPISLGDNSVGYIGEEVDDWLAARAAERDDDTGAWLEARRAAQRAAQRDSAT